MFGQQTLVGQTGNMIHAKKIIRILPPESNNQALGDTPVKLFNSPAYGPGKDHDSEKTSIAAILATAGYQAGITRIGKVFVKDSPRNAP